MTTESKRTAHEHALRMAESGVEFYTQRVEGHIKWLESNIADLRREVERGTIHETRNMVATAADVADSAAKLRAAYEQVAVLKSLTEGDNK